MTASPVDPALPHLSDLLHPDRAAEIMEAAFPSVEVTSVRLSDVAYRPGASVTVRYALTVVGEPEPVTVTAVHGGQLPAGGLRVSAGSTEIGLWRFPDDPGLPGLAAVFDPPALARLLAEVGLVGAPVSIRLRAHRPGRRAVIEVTAGASRVFVKVVRPKRVAELQSIHEALAPAVPIPRSRGWDPGLGLVVLEALPGVPLTGALLGGRRGDVAGPDELVDLLERIAGCAVDARPRPGPLGRAADHAATLSLLLPEAQEALAEVVAAAGSAPTEPPIIAHRDFHASQLLIHQGRLRLVDVDTVGLGSRADDLAMLLAQLICLERPGPAQAVVEAYREVVTRRLTEVVDPGSLRVRTAAAMLGFALGPHRVQEAGWREETGRRIHRARELVAR